LTSIPPAPIFAAAEFKVEPLFDPGDLQDPANLATRLCQPEAEDPVVPYLRALLSAETLELLDAYDASTPPPPTLLAALAHDLQGLLQTWTAQRDLLGSQPDDYHVVVEMDNQRRAHVRFGDGALGRLPAAGSEFSATYRIGNGPAGNVGAETITHVLLRRTKLSGVSLRPRNPLPAQGGAPPEPLEEVKLFAPYAFRARLERAVTADDYAQVVMRDFAGRVQRAAATLRWTGAWTEVLVAVDPWDGAAADPALLAEIEGHLYRYRRIGHDLVVRAAHYVPLDVELLVCVQPGFLRGHVKAALLERFSNRALPDGGLGFFHPDNLSFGQGIKLSQIVAAAQAVPGVENVTVTRLERFVEGPNGEIEQGLLPLGPFEIARLDNDPTFPENGLLKLDLRGGR
jgi:predicted phage baseplate assembly protein